MFYHPQGTCAISIHNGRSLARLVFFTAAPALGAWNESLNNVILSIPFHCLAGQSLRRMLCRAPILWRCRRFTVAGALVPFSPGRVPPEDSSLVWKYATLLQTADSCPTISPLLDTSEPCRYAPTQISLLPHLFVSNANVP